MQRSVDETADAPQPKRQRGEPRQPDCQQASEEALILPISAAPAPAVTVAPAAAGDPSADLRVCSQCSPYVHLQCCWPGRRPCLEILVAHDRSCPWVSMKVQGVLVSANQPMSREGIYL